MIETLQKTSIEGTYLNIIKIMYNKQTGDIVLNGDNLKTFSYSRFKEKAHFLFPFQVQVNPLPVVFPHKHTLFLNNPSVFVIPLFLVPRVF